ncbi:MAG: cytochrome P450 [Novosphingobium sp.]|nr:cytochrome P450 [Novosphingobium sp.]
MQASGSRPVSEAGRAPPVYDVDLYADDVQGNLYPHLAAMRSFAPIVYIPRYDVYYAVAYEAVKAALTNWRDFGSEGGIGLIDSRTVPGARRAGPIVGVDPPDHTPHRRLFVKMLSPAVAKRMRASFDAVAERMVGELIGRGRFDVVDELIRPFVVTVLADAVGIPEEGRHHLLILGEMTLASVGPHNERFDAANRAVIEAGSLQWLAEVSRRDALGPVGFGADVYAAVDRGEIDEETAAALVTVFLFGGVDTTVTTLANGMRNFLDHPDQYALLAANPMRAGEAFDEMLRFNVPVQQMYRTVTRPTELAGIALPQGARIGLGIAGANRDPTHFADPDVFDISRRSAGHFGFGTGIHACVGQMVARMEAEALLSAFARRIAGFALVDEPERWISGGLASWTALPIEVHAK